MGPRNQLVTYVLLFQVSNGGLELELDLYVATCYREEESLKLNTDS
jgi:hypothetical protein